MINKKWLVVILLSFFLISLIFFALVFFKKRQSLDIQDLNINIGDEIVTDDQEIMSVENDQESGKYLKDEDKIEDEEESEADDDTTEVKEKFIDVSESDCKEKCKKYEDDSEDLRYCQEICGLKEISVKDSTDECEDLEGLDEDYCLRDVAVKKLDFSICNKIEDAGILKVCHNRITEELIDNRDDL